MAHPVTPAEAQAALNDVASSRRRVIDEIDLPRWYWWGLALGWVGLGVLTDLRHAWLTAVATFAFGAVHASVAPRVLSGRHRTQQLSVSAEVAGGQAPRLVIGSLLLLAALTVAGSLAAAADGARHPVTVTSVVVAVMIVLGGPRLLSVIRRKAARSVAAS